MCVFLLPIYRYLFILYEECVLHSWGSSLDVCMRVKYYYML